MSQVKSVDQFVQGFKKSGLVNRIFMTGANGSLGNELLPYLKQLYGEENILLTDLKNTTGLPEKQFKSLDMTDRDSMDKLIKDFRPDTILHLASVLSAGGEKDPTFALRVNSSGSMNAIELANEHGCRIFGASTIASMGPESNKVLQNLEIQRPKTVYGISKVFMELLGEYHNHKNGLDFRSIRYPVVIAPSQAPTATAMCTIDMYYGAIKNKAYQMYLKPEQRLPIIYIDDLITGTLQFIEAPNENLKYRTYNISSTSFSIGEQVESVKKVMPEFKVTYEIDSRQKIADTWPHASDATEAIEHWGYQPQYDLDAITKVMFEKVPDMLDKYGH